MEPSLIAALTSVPFAILMCVLIWNQYAKVAPSMLDVIKQNATAMEKFASALEANSRAIERLSDALASVEPRLLELQQAQSRMVEQLREMRDDDRAERNRPRVVGR